MAFDLPSDRRHGVKRPAFACLVAMLVVIDCPALCSALDSNKIDQSEQVVFGHANSTMSDDERVAALETSLYGKPKHGNIDKRLNGIAEIVGAGRSEVPHPAPSFTRLAPPAASSVGASAANENAPITGHVSVQEEARVLLTRGMQENSEGRFAEAERTFKQAAERDPGNADALYNLGALAEREGDTHKAVFYYQGALRLNPEDVELKEAVSSLEARAQHEHAIAQNDRGNGRVLNGRAESENVNAGAGALDVRPQAEPFKLASSKSHSKTPVLSVHSGGFGKAAAGILFTGAIIGAGVALGGTGLHCPMCRVINMGALHCPMCRILRSGL